jgi:hypothetical protein
VIGEEKSAADMIYASMKAKKFVSWLIRSTGIGSRFFLFSKEKGPYKMRMRWARRDWLQHLRRSFSVRTIDGRDFFTELTSEERFYIHSEARWTLRFVMRRILMADMQRKGSKSWTLIHRQAPISRS